LKRQKSGDHHNVQKEKGGKGKGPKVQKNLGHLTGEKKEKKGGTSKVITNTKKVWCPQ